MGKPNQPVEAILISRLLHGGRSATGNSKNKEAIMFNRKRKRQELRASPYAYLLALAGGAGKNGSIETKALASVMMDLVIEITALRECVSEFRRLLAIHDEREERDVCESTSGSESTNLTVAPECPGDRVPRLLSPARRDVVKMLAEVFSQAYQRIAYLSHNNAGPSSGIEKVFSRFCGMESDEAGIAFRHLTAAESRCSVSVSGYRGTRKTPEEIMLGRLGLSEQEMEAFRCAADEAEMFT